MAISTKSTDVEILQRGDSGSGYVDWGAIFAGATLAAAISMSLLAFGSTLGLSLTSFAESRNAVPGLGVVIAIGLWLLWLQVVAALGGGYIAGRLRRRIGDAQKHEVEMRDGMHGLIVWAAGVLLGAMLAGLIAALGVMSASTVSAGAASNPQAANMADYYIDRLMRPSVTAAPAEGEASSTPPLAAGDQRAISADARAEFGRLLSSNRVTASDSEDRTYLVQQLMAQTGMSEQQATDRLDTTLIIMKAQADQARRMAVMMGFLTVVSLLISAVSAWWAATKGGDHRDQSVDHSHFASWR